MKTFILFDITKKAAKLDIIFINLCFILFDIKKKAVESYLLNGSIFEEEKNNNNAINYFRSRDSSESANENANNSNKNTIVEDYKKFVEEKQKEKNKTNYFEFFKKSKFYSITHKSSFFVYYF